MKSAGVKCPFCGLKRNKIKKTEIGFFVVECRCCGARGPVGNHAEQGMEHWNDQCAPACSENERDKRLLLAEQILSDLATGYWTITKD